MFKKNFYITLRDKAYRVGYRRKIREENMPCLSSPMWVLWEVLSYQIYIWNIGIGSIGDYVYTIYKKIEKSLSYTVKNYKNIKY